MRLVTIWSSEKKDAEGIPVRDKGSVTYSAAIESAAERDTDPSPSDFVRRVEREASRRGFGATARTVFLGDGAKLIWNIADTYYPDAIQIVDLYHAKGSFSEAAKAIFGPTNEVGCKPAIGTRLKRAGMLWTVAGADAIIARRCCRLSGRFEDLWEWRSAG